MERGDGSVLKFKGRFFQKIFSFENELFQKNITELLRKVSHQNFKTIYPFME
jgi:hypothetical protein